MKAVQCAPNAYNKGCNVVVLLYNRKQYQVNEFKLLSSYRLANANAMQLQLLCYYYVAGGL